MMELMVILSRIFSIDAAIRPWIFARTRAALPPRSFFSDSRD
jgi:hypothetical protein